MEVYISQMVHARQIDVSTKMVKSFVSNMMPQIGFKLQDPAFRHGVPRYEVEDVIINYDENETWVLLAPVELDTNDKEDVKDFIREYKSHGWENPIPLR